MRRSLLKTLIPSNFLIKASRIIPDKLYLKIMYKRIIGERLNINHPKNFNEKLQWLKLHDRNPEYAKYVDKYTVKKKIADVLGKEYIIPLLGVWDSFEDIDFSKLPETFVLKTTHDSGGVVICKNKADFDYIEARNVLNKSMSRNYYWLRREFPYKNVKPRIMAEQYMTDETGSQLKDYKVFLFGGKAEYIQVDYDRFIDHHRNFYTTQWEYVPFTTLYPTNKNKNIEKPMNLEELLMASEKVSNALGDPAVLRVDFYVIYNKIYFGEVTFYHGAGMEKFHPEEYNYILGEKIILKK